MSSAATQTAEFPTAIVDGAVFGREVAEVQVRRSKANRGRCVAQFYAPGWRPMAFTSVDAAKAKMERHPGFVRWVA